MIESLGQGFRFVERLREEWKSGANRFCLPGEALFEARQAGCLVGVCGLNRDPYVDDASIGRLRRLYVSTAARRSGVGRALVRCVIASAGGGFKALHLRSQVGATEFYREMGFRTVDGDPYVTHRMNL